MNPDTITRWLHSSAALPEQSEVAALLQAWPWFIPARLMEAAQEHSQKPFSPKTLSLVQLYGNDWLIAYRMATAAGDHFPIAIGGSREISRDQEGAESNPVFNEAPKAIKPDLQLNPAPYATPLMQPLFTEDYFRHQGIEAPEPARPAAPPEDPKTLMVMMSFADWLAHFKTKNEKEQEEERDKRAFRSMWQQEKLAAALEEETEEIPEEVFEMAVSSITREDDLASESLAEILEKQEKWAAAAEMYRKLGLRNPAKSSYFASRAEAVKKRLL